MSCPGLTLAYFFLLTIHREDDDLDEDLPLYFAMDSRVAQSSCKKSTTLIWSHLALDEIYDYNNV